MISCSDLKASEPIRVRLLNLHLHRIRLMRAVPALGSSIGEVLCVHHFATYELGKERRKLSLLREWCYF